MEVKMHTETTRLLQNVYSGCVPCEQATELSLTDDLPNIREILYTESLPLLRGKEAENGKLKIKGVVQFTVLYAAEQDGEYSKFETEIPFLSEITCTNADETCDIFCTLQLSSCSAKLLSSRIILAKNEVLLHVFCWKEENIVITCVPSCEESSMEIKPLAKTVLLPANICEKSFIVTDTFQISDQSAPISELLLQSVRIQIEEAKPVGTKLIVKGCACTDILYRTGNAAVPCRAEFTTVFSQIIDSDTTIPENGFDLYPALTGAFFHTEASLSPDERQIIQELHIAAQCMVYQETEISCVDDAYSIKYPCTCQTEPLRFFEKHACRRRSFSIQGTIPSSHSGRVLFASVHLGKPEQIDAQDSCTISIPCDSSVLLARDDTTLCGLQHRFRVAEPCPDMEPKNMSHILYGDLNAVTTASGIELRLPAELDAAHFREIEMNVVRTMTLDEDSAYDNSAEPSIIVHKHSGTDSLWALAKKYRTSVSQICEVNNIANEAEIEPHRLIIIPKGI